MESNAKAKYVDIPELTSLFGELDLQELYSSYLVENYSGLKKLKMLLPKHKKTCEIRRMQIDFVHKVQIIAKNESVLERAYLLLGALQFVQGRWTPFPSTGILYELVLKASDLEQMISENAEAIDLGKLFEHPNLIKEMADDALRRLLSNHPDILS